MAEESVDLPLNPEPKSRGVEFRRYSTGKANSGNIEEKVVPHYRRASTGSCHDFCKYGWKPAFVKERDSIAEKVTINPLCRSSKEVVGGTKTSVAKLRASVNPKKASMVNLRESGYSKPTKRTLLVKLNESVDSEPQISDTSDTNRKKMPTKSPNSPKHVKIEVPVKRKKTSLVNVKPSIHPKAHTSDLPKTLRQENSSISREVETSSKATAEKVETSSKATAEKLETSSKATVEKVETSSKATVEKVETSSKSTVKKVETSSNSNAKLRTSSKPTAKKVGTSLNPTSLKAKEMKLSERHVTSSKPNSVTVKKIFSLNPSEGSSGQRNSKLKMEKRAASSKVAARKLMTPSRASLPPKPSLNRVASINARKPKSLKIVSHLKDQPKTRKVESKEPSNIEVEEKTLYVVEMKSGNQTLQSDQNASDDVKLFPSQSLSPLNFSSSSVSESPSQKDQEESKYTTGEVTEVSFSGNLEIEHMGNGEALEEKEKGKPRKGGSICSEDKGRQMPKLKFSRGKLVEFQSEENNPRRLKFQIAKVLGKNANVKAEDQRKSFKRRYETDINRNGTTCPEKVVLRHRHGQGKKNLQGLFNNVIEETAGKLAEIRKSKVKALVGAFETVISLQEKNPLANTVY